MQKQVRHSEEPKQQNIKNTQQEGANTHKNKQQINKIRGEQQLKQMDLKPLYKIRQKFVNDFKQILLRIQRKNSQALQQFSLFDREIAVFEYTKLIKEVRQQRSKQMQKQKQLQQMQHHGEITQSVLTNKSQVQKLNQTPFFGIQNESKVINKNSNNNQRYKKIEEIFKKITDKNSQALQQLQQKYRSPQKNEPALNIFSKIFQKTVQSIKQFKNKYQQMDTRTNIIKAQSISINNSQIKMKQDQDNQFMTKDFASSQVKKFVNQLRNKVVQKVILDSTDRNHQIVNFIQLTQRTIRLNFLLSSFLDIKRIKIKTPLNDPSLPNKRDSERINSSVSQRISSAQSQRLRSGLSKNSQNEDSFNLELTAKTKNSRNPFQMGKVDSLMYSVDSGFGFVNQSPNRNIKVQNNPGSSHSVREDMQDNATHKQEQKRSSALKKSYSQRIQPQKLNQKIKRQLTLSPKQRIQETQQHQNQIEEQNKNKKNQNQFQRQSSGYDNQFDNIKALDEQQKQKERINQEQKENKIKKQAKQLKKSKLYKNESTQKLSKKQKHSKYNDDKDVDYQSSIKEDTIINKAQNFDADDQQQNFNQKLLHQSVKLNHNIHAQKSARKRVQTQANKIKKQKKKQEGNYSIKNIKRFNKVDFSKLQQGQSGATSQVISHQNSSNNIFATQINNYQQKITKLREEKQMKKKLLEKQLAKINQQIKVLHQKQQQENSPNSKNNYASRLKISDNSQALKKAESLVKNLRSQKRSRNIAKIGQFSNLDKNINEYMEQLTKLRAQNEQKMKQKKKLQILERMKQNQVRKISEKKKISQNQQFVLHLKGADSINNLKLQPIVRTQNNSKRTPTKSSKYEQQKIFMPQIDNVTPQLSQKKAYLHKVRGFSVKKDSVDAYQQYLG